MPGRADPGAGHRTGVLLFNLGGPETPADVRPFLYRLFSDPEIIRIKNNLARRALAWFIATTRQRKSRDLYRQIGGGSPLRKITEGQASALEDKLRSRGCPARVFVGMRCWKPSIDEAAEQLQRDGVTRLVVLPLFPQFSVTTTGSCTRYFRSVLERKGAARAMEVTFIDCWYGEPLYVEAMADLIRATLEGFSDGTARPVQLLYSAHSIPARYVLEGDPYLEQTRATVELIDRRLKRPIASRLSFQSKIGPVRWLEPSTKNVLAELGRAGVKRLAVVPISFVSDHIETLQEMDILYRQVATDAGITEFRRVPSLNVYPKFIDALADLVSRNLSNSGTATKIP
jgi:protoporphyrin/coproporphyrin ferrochelatase